MELHGSNPKQIVIAVIPARYGSVRLPGKLLLEINGKPLILHTLEQAGKAAIVSKVIVATDDARIFDVVSSNRNEAVMTSPDHTSGSDRIAEVAESLPEGSIIVNVQGDEPLISPETIEAAVEALIGDPSADVATTCEPIVNIADVFSPNVVKVVADKNGNALYFSRSAIPFLRDEVNRAGGLEFAIKDNPGLLNHFKKHTGLYVYRREFLLRYAKMEPTGLEQSEMLEQLRILENGWKIKVVEVEQSSIGVDTVDDLKKVQRVLEEQSIKIRKALPEDIPAIAKVHVESWQRSFEGIAPTDYLNNMSVEKRKTVFAERLSEPLYTLLVAENPRHGIVGFIDFGLRPASENFGYEARIFSFYFLRQFQRCGFGTKLFTQCMKKIVDSGYKSVCLDTLEISPYRGFYERMGGRVVAKDSHKLGDAEFPTVIYGWENLGK